VPKPEIGPVMLTEPEHLQAQLIGQFDLLDQVAQSIGGGDRLPCLRTGKTSAKS
jgi:hypothetical protein